MTGWRNSIGPLAPQNYFVKYSTNFWVFPFMILNDRADIISGQINMSLRNTIHYMETRGSSGQGSLIQHDLI